MTTLAPQMDPHSATILSRLADMLSTRRPDQGGDPNHSYGAKLLAAGPDAFLKKIGEEACEVILAAKNREPEPLIHEIADLWFHCLVALAHYQLRPEQVFAELARREGQSGLAEKASRPTAPLSSPCAKAAAKTETTSANCVFCQISNGAIPTQFVYEDEEFAAFHDIRPAAPVHLLLIPRHHIASLQDITANDAGWLGRMMALVPQLALDNGCQASPEGGFKLLANAGLGGGQEVFHLHFHIIGGLRPGQSRLTPTE